MLRAGAQLRRRLLREPDAFLVVAKVVVAQLRVAVEPEPAPDDAVEAADEEVGEEVRRRLVLRAVHLVAVCSREPLVAGEVGAAVRVRDDNLVAVRGVLDRGPDPLGAVVQLRRDRAHVDVPATPGGDPLHMLRKGTTRYDHLRHPGDVSWTMKGSLKSARPVG